MRHLLLWSLLLPSLASAEIYRWTDAQGRVHFGAQPGRQGAQQIEVRPQVVERDDATRAREQRTEQFYDARRQERERAASQAAEQRTKRAAECRQLRSQLQQIERGGRYYTVDAQGNRSYISDTDLDNSRSRLSRQITERCS